MVETVTIQKFKSKDGNVYDTIEKAERADKEWDQKQSFDAQKEVSVYEKMCEKNFERIQKRIDVGKKQFPSFWMTEQKYGQDYYMCNGFDDMLEMGWTAFIMWYDYYQCDTDEIASVAGLIKETENKKAALAFVLDRCSYCYEYERMEEIYVKTFGDEND